MWTADDGRKWAAGLPEHSFDLMLTCPPYYDLERYSDDPADLSAMSPGDFNASWTDMLADCGRALRPDRFAVIVTGDTRGRGGGAVRDLRGVTIRAAAAAGLEYCNGAVLLTPIGSVPYAAARLFTGTRGLGRCHQDVLVFCKGDRGAAAQALGEVAVELPPGLADA
jgi:DNA modification methylase